MTLRRTVVCSRLRLRFPDGSASDISHACPMCTRAPSHPFARWHSSVASIAPNVTTNLPVYAVLSAICMAFMLPQNVRYEHTRARYSNDTRTRNSRGERGTISRSPQIGEPLDSASANPLMRSRQWVSSLFLLHQGNLAELWRTGRDTVDGYVTQILVAGAPLSPQFRCAYRSILAGPYLAEGTDLKSSATERLHLSPRAHQSAALALSSPLFHLSPWRCQYSPGRASSCSDSSSGLLPCTVDQSVDGRRDNSFHPG